MSIWHLTTPVTDEDIEKIHIGDVIYLTGDITTGRDDVHHRVVVQGRDCPVDLKGKAVFHAGPIMKKISEDKWKCVAVGPTTSMRMEKAEKEFLAATGVKIVIGKGGMGPKTTEGCKESKAVHTIFPGGCAVFAAECIEDVEGVEWLDLGMPEAMWKFKAKEFGPLIVSIDCHGGNLIDDNKVKFNERKEKLVPEISEKVQFMH